MSVALKAAAWAWRFTQTVTLETGEFLPLEICDSPGALETGEIRDFN